LVTEKAMLNCAHVPGLVSLEPSQQLVRIDGQHILVQSDPEGRPIHGCPNIALGIVPCRNTVDVKSGYSTLIRIDGHAVCLASLKGLTDGTPPRTVLYTVRDPAQQLVVEESPGE
jgi:hypothetical protein